MTCKTLLGAWAPRRHAPRSQFSAHQAMRVKVLLLRCGRYCMALGQVSRVKHIPDPREKPEAFVLVLETSVAIFQIKWEHVRVWHVLAPQPATHYWCWRQPLPFLPCQDGGNQCLNKDAGKSHFLTGECCATMVCKWFRSQTLLLMPKSWHIKGQATTLKMHLIECLLSSFGSACLSKP